MKIFIFPKSYPIAFIFFTKLHFLRKKNSPASIQCFPFFFEKHLHLKKRISIFENIQTKDK
jgi:hypothetical protein